MIRNGEFGHQEYFQELCDTVDGGDDFYLVGNDFKSYLEVQVRHFHMLFLYLHISLLYVFEPVNILVSISFWVEMSCLLNSIITNLWHSPFVLT